MGGNCIAAPRLPIPCDRGANMTWQQQHLVSTPPLALALILILQRKLNPNRSMSSTHWVPNSLNSIWFKRLNAFFPFPPKSSPYPQNKILELKQKSETKIMGVVTWPLQPFPHYTVHNTLRPPLPPLRKHPPARIISGDFKISPVWKVCKSIGIFRVLTGDTHGVARLELYKSRVFLKHQNLSVSHFRAWQGLLIAER